MRRYEQDKARRLELDELQAVRARVAEADAASTALAEIDRRIHDVQRELDLHPYAFDRRFLFRVLSMGHSQFAELVGARGPNTQVNSACASTTQAIALAEDWIHAGRCRRVVIVAADDAHHADEFLFPFALYFGDNRHFAVVVDMCKTGEHLVRQAGEVAEKAEIQRFF